MFNDAKIGLLLGLVFIFVIAFVINEFPQLRLPGSYAVERLGSSQLVTPLGADNSLDLVEAVRSSLEMGSLSLGAPSSLSFGQPAFIELSLGKDYGHIGLSADESSERMRTHGLSISNEMLARLSGTGFRIEAMTPESQLVGVGKETVWRWSVEPTKTGKQHLSLTLSANLHINGKETPYVVLVHDHSVDVHVSLAHRIVGFIKREWKWLWAAVFVPVAGWVLYDKRRERNRRRSSAYLGLPRR